MVKSIYKNAFFWVFILLFTLSGCVSKSGSSRILVFSKTDGFRHILAIEAGKKAFLEIGQEEGIEVDTTENASFFTDENLKKYRAVVFLNVSGDVFNRQQEIAFQRYIEAGGGFLAIHGPTDAERDWPWYGKLIGAYFESHPSDPNVQEGTYQVIDTTHSATRLLPQKWVRTDEFYNFQQVNPNINVLITIDESTYNGGTMGKKHPMVWYHDFDGGRSFYTAMGHTPETYAEPHFLEMIKGGLHYVMGGDAPPTLDYSGVKPEENRFSKQVLVEGLDEPMQMDIASDGRIYVAERRGDIKVYDPVKSQIKTVGTIPVTSRYEDGLLGLALDPDFTHNRRLYLFYTSSDGKHFRISRFTCSENDELISSSEKNLLSIPKEVLDGSHTGGGLKFNDQTKNLYITVGDNSSPRATGYAPLDERQGRKVYNAARSAGNTNDLRGAILRIHPEEDGTYSIPEGNLFPPGTPNTRPEIYVMGNRQPWRLSIDSKTGWIFWGEVGPDARIDSAAKGPMGYDEFNRAKEPGNYGWPFVIGPNLPYKKYDFASKSSGELYEPKGPINDSQYNTGKKVLPPANQALIWYPYEESKDFPIMGSGGRSAVGGPIFREADFQRDSENVFPSYYEGKWFITEWLRGWIHVVSLDKNGNFEWMERFLPNEGFSGPMDMQFGPDGSLYVLAYGKGWFKANEEAGIIRIDFNDGNRAPKVIATASKKAGALPLTINFSSRGTEDFDHHKLKYTWDITDSTGQKLVSLTEKNPSFTFEDSGIYTAKLTVTDELGASNSRSLEITAGNEPPAVNIEVMNGNSSFFFPGKPIQYQVEVNDKEDGSLKDGAIDDSEVIVKIDYLPGGYNPTSKMGKEKSMNTTYDLIAPMTINASDCYSCHELNGKSIGPSFQQIANRYNNNANIVISLTQKVIEGGAGNWGKAVMSAHPALSEKDAKLMVQYILNLDDQNSENDQINSSRPVAGNFNPNKQENEGGAYVLNATYTDKGGNGMPPLRSHDQVVLRQPNVSPKSADKTKGFMRVPLANSNEVLYFLHGDGSYIAFQTIDLTGISNINISASPVIGGFFEVRTGAPDGELLGMSKKQDASQFNIPIKSLSDKRDLFLVARNDTAASHQILFSVQGLEFQHADN